MGPRLSLVGRKTSGVESSGGGYVVIWVSLRPYLMGSNLLLNPLESSVEVLSLDLIYPDIRSSYYLYLTILIIYH